MSGSHPTIRIGITGISTSGKTTIVNELKKTLKLHCVAGDDFFIRTGNYPMLTLGGREHPNWDTPDAINWKAFAEKVSVSSDSMLIVDSFQLFYCEDIVKQLDAVIVLEYTTEDFQEALKRRVYRLTQEMPPEDYRENPYKSESHREALYFEEVVWKTSFEQSHLWDAKQCDKPVLRLKATGSIDESVKASIEFVSSLLNQRQ